VTKRILSMKNSNDTIGNRTRDLPVCSAVPQPLRYHVPLSNTHHMKIGGLLYKYADMTSIDLDIKMVFDMCHINMNTHMHICIEISSKSTDNRNIFKYR
jgi:hypothetical protein